MTNAERQELREAAARVRRYRDGEAPATIYRTAVTEYDVKLLGGDEDLLLEYAIQQLLDSSDEPTTEQE